MEDKEIIISQDVPAIADNTLIQLAEQAEKRIEAMGKIKRIALKLTNRHDWTDQNGKPYLQVSGAEKVGRLFGISWRIDEPVHEIEEGGHFSYTYKGYFSLAGATIEAIGTRSSKDGFFTRYEYGPKDDNGKSKRTALPPSAIDKGDVKKAAYTNLLGNGITRILGLRNLTYEDLQEYAGITKEMIAKVEYKNKGKSTDKDIPSENATPVEFCPSDVRKATGEKNGKPWTKFTIKDGETDYGTFSETFAKTAKEAKEAGRKIKVTFKKGKFGNDIENVTFADDGPGRNPGDE